MWKKCILFHLACKPMWHAQHSDGFWTRISHCKQKVFFHCTYFFPKQLMKRWHRAVQKWKLEAQWHASHIVSCPVYLPKFNRQWQNEIRAVRPDSHTHYWSRAFYWYRNCTTGQQTLENRCYFMKGLAMSHSRSAKLKGYLTTPESERATLIRWKCSYEICIQMAVHPRVQNQQLGREMQIKGSLLSLMTHVLHQSLFTYDKIGFFMILNGIYVDNGSNQRATCSLGSASLQLPSDTLIHLLLGQGWA